MPQKSSNSKIRIILLFFLVFTAGLTGFSKAEQFEFFVIWGDTSKWNIELTIENGRFDKVEPYLFTGDNDKIDSKTDTKIAVRSGTWGGIDGLHINADIRKDASVTFSSNRATRKVRLKSLVDTDQKLIYINDNKDFLIFGAGAPYKGPKGPRQIPMPQVYEAPQPGEAVSLADKWTSEKTPVEIAFSSALPETISIRRHSKNDGLLYLELYSPEKNLTGRAEVKIAGEKVAARDVDGSLWLSLEPRIGKIIFLVDGSGNSRKRSLKAATTLVEVRGTKIYLNGEPFLIKGTLPRNLTAEDARYIKTLGMNTLRGQEAREDAEKYDFMAIAAVHRGPWRIVWPEKSPTTEDFTESVREYLDRMKNNAAKAAASPNILIIQLANEQATGNDPWSDWLSDIRQFERLDYLLANAYNLVKPFSPMIPIGYSNHARGYIAPMFLDVYMHNTYLNEDRYHLPWDTFMKWQSCDKRPWVETEWGANRYTPQAYQKGSNNPVLEKIHAWNYPNRWKKLMGQGTVGGTNYCLYDLERPWDQGTSRFGLMTYERKPKLACWDVEHMWRDFEVTPVQDTNSTQLKIRYKRDYYARNCRLAVRAGNNYKVLEIDEFAPGTQRTVKLPFETDEIHWRITYTTHRGLPMIAKGAHPLEVEKKEFIEKLKDRETYSFLKELLDTKVVTVEGQDPPPTIAEIKRQDQVAPFGFQQPDGTVYITAFSRERIKDEIYVKTDIQTAFDGKVVAVDEFTGEPLETKVNHTKTAKGIKLLDVKAPRIPGPIGSRAEERVFMPVFRITPE